ncbi:MAG TPA: glycosyltransferase family 39 protein [Thermoanaerobaculia bacterium]|nr:glycosyltransferase family 39 protein [Thermoanaerobaculia bacterium]
MKHYTSSGREEGGSGAAREMPPVRAPAASESRPKTAAPTLPAGRWRVGLWPLAALAITAFSFFVRLYPIHLARWWDEAAYLQHAEVFFSGRTNFDELALRPPMLSLLIAAVFTIRHDVVAASVLVAALGALGVLFSYLLGARLQDRATGLLAAFLLAVLPYAVTASHWIITDVPAATFLIVAIHLLFVAAGRDDPFLYTLSGVAFGVAILTRFTSAVPALIVPLFFLMRMAPARRMGFVAAGMASLIAPYLAWCHLRFGFFLTPFIRASRAVSDRVGDATYYFRNFTEIYPPFVVTGLVLWAAVLLFRVRPFFVREPRSLSVGVRIRIEENLGRSLRSADGILLLSVIVFLACISAVPHKEPRYLLPIAGPVLLLSAHGYRQMLSAQGRWTRIAVIAILVSLTIPALTAAAGRLRQPLVVREASEPVAIARHILALRRPGVIYTHHDYPVYAYYTALPTIAVPWDESFYSSQRRIMRSPGYFIYYKNVGKQPSREWLDADPRFRRLREWSEAILYEYRP